MKKLLITALCGLAAASPAYAAPLTVNLEGVRNTGGRLHVSVQTREQFRREGGIAGSAMSLPQAGSHRFSYDVPAGEYVVSVWHDDNANGRFDKDERSMPLDGWALVNGAQLRGEPSFEQARTVVADAPVTVRLEMIYGR